MLLLAFGMEVVTVSSAATRTPLGLSARCLAPVSLFKKPIIVSFKNDTNKNVALITPQQECVAFRMEADKEYEKSSRKFKQHPERVNAVATDETFPCTLDLDFNEAAAKLEYIYETSPEASVSVEDDKNQRVMGRQTQRNWCEEVDEPTGNVVRSRRKKEKRLNLEKRIAIKMKKEGEFLRPSSCQRKHYYDVNTEKLVREYSSSTDLVSIDWKKMKIPPVLPSSEHAWLFKLIQPMKEILLVKENLQNDLGRQVAEGELAAAIKIDTALLKKRLEIGRAARNKLIKHNLRLVLFVMNKHFEDFVNGLRFQDLCQAGVNGLITAIDRFEPNRKLRLSTYSLYWIRHAISRSFTVSSFTKVSFGLHSIRAYIKRARLELMFELQRLPTDEEIIDRIGITLERCHEVMRVSKPVFSLHAQHAVTQEEFIHGVTEVDAVDGDRRRKPALLRLALDDVLDSLKPKESLVIRQRYGLDGKGDRTLGEIAANLNISREMARKHEVKALMKLKHPARVNYLQRNIFK